MIQVPQLVRAAKIRRNTCYIVQVLHAFQIFFSVNRLHIDVSVSYTHLYAYKKVCRYVTPEIESEVDNILGRWFPEGKYELIEE